MNYINKITLPDASSYYFKDINAMPKSGGTFTGAVTLAGDPTANLQPTTKQYVDNQVSAANMEVVVGTHASATSTLTGTLNTISALSDGVVIYFLNPYDLPAAAATLTLTYTKTNTTTNAIPIYTINNQPNTTAYPAYSILILVYYNNKFYIANNTVTYINGDEVAY